MSETFSCPHCMYHFRQGDQRYAVPPGQRDRVIVCPGCREQLRVWADGARPPDRGWVGCLVLAVIVLAVILIAARFSEGS